MLDYSTGKNLASDVITNKIKVSTAMFLGHDGSAGYETWIFSDDENQKSRQIWHRSKHQALKAHEHIVKNLKTQEI